MLNKYTTSHRAFTLIELLVTLVMLSVLLAIAIPQYNQTLENNKEAILMSSVYQIQNALDVYCMQQVQLGLPKAYPLSLSELNNTMYFTQTPINPWTNGNMLSDTVSESGIRYTRTSTLSYELCIITPSRGCITKEARP